MRIGNGYDVHAFAENRDLILGGVKIDHERGLLGHSDADVLTHAIMDALLGALGLRDIGYHFPDTDPKYKDISSLKLLAHVMEIIESKGYEVVNVDTVIACQRPKLNPHIPKMQENLADLLKVQIDQISIKATTTEKLGFVGKEEGIEVYAVCLLRKES